MSRSEPKPVKYDPAKQLLDQTGLEPVPEVPARKGERALAEWLEAFEQPGPTIQTIR